MKNTYKEPCYLWDAKQESVPDVKIKSKLLKLFKSRKWKKNSKDTNKNSPFTLPKLKIAKDDAQADSDRALVRRTRSCPMDKPATVWCTQHSFQASHQQEMFYQLIPQVAGVPTVSVATQTECSYQARMGKDNRNHRRVRQVSFSEEFLDNKHLAIGSGLSDIEQELMNAEFEIECNKEVIQALSRKPPDRLDNVSKQRQMEVGSITVRYKY